MEHRTAEQACNWFEGVVVVIFTLEFLLRLYAAPENPAFVAYRGDWRKRLRFLVVLAHPAHSIAFRLTSLFVFPHPLTLTQLSPGEHLLAR
jgi:hypothetical protein